MVPIPQDETIIVHFVQEINRLTPKRERSRNAIQYSLYYIGLKILRIAFGTVSGPDRTGNNQRASEMAKVNDFAVESCGDFDSN